MKQALLWIFLCLAMSGVLSAQEASSKGASPAASDRLFFPRDMFWGYGQFDLAPPHNEIDPNLCRADAGISGGVNDPCNAFARYMLSGYVEVGLSAAPNCGGFSCSENLDSYLARIFRKPFIPGRSTPSEWSGAGVRESTWGRASKCAGPSTFCSAASALATGTWGQPTSVPMARGAGTTLIGVRKYFGQRRY